jgi:hypothetical protein
MNDGGTGHPEGQIAMKTIFALTLAAAAAFGSVPASADTACLQQAQIYSWKALSNRVLVVEDNFHKKFKLTLMAPCERLLFHERLGFKTFSNSALACVSKGDQVISGTSIGPQHCPISTIELYTPEMEKADKAAEAAKAAGH